MSRKKIIEKIAKELENEELITSEIKMIIEDNHFIEHDKFITRNHNKREVVDITKFNKNEQVILRYYQLLLNEIFQIKQPNRNFIIKQLTNIAPYLRSYHSPIIFKFDFKSFFSSIEMSKVINQIKDNPQLHTKELDFLEKTFPNRKKIVPGLGIINSFTEIIGNKFDKKIEIIFKDKLVVYERYVDDGILILDGRIEEDYIREEILKVGREMFGQKISFNEEKTKYINFKEYTNRENTEIRFDYLGYQFNYEVNFKKRKFSFGVANSKIEKEKLKIRNIIYSFEENLNLELLIIRIDTYYKRLVYFGKDKDLKKYAWKVRGISDSYKEATRLFDYKEERYIPIALDDETLRLFDGSLVIEAFKAIFKDEKKYTKAEINDIKRAENILENRHRNDWFISSLYNNKAVLLNPKIGYTKEYLSKVIEKSGISLNGELIKYEYDDLINVFMEKIYYI